MIVSHVLEEAIRLNVAAALAEDVGEGDITAQLIPEHRVSTARIISRQSAVICGLAWADAVFRRLDPSVNIEWQVKDGDWVTENQCIVTLNGNARALLTGERTAMNFIQTLSSTSTACRALSDLVAGTGVKLLDTRKTLPGLRIALKYAVTVGGCFNHRIGLYDAFLIKENHINACGSIEASIAAARALAPGKPVEVEVETLDELDEALAARADVVMLDNFPLDEMKRAVKRAQGITKLEASGGINRDTLLPIAETGVDYISIGALTKDCQAVDLSMRFD